jgi:Asp-tRNA(Asn)/Glu-tRNA(Gln) amidotransferase A subunit family amidase
MFADLPSIPEAAHNFRVGRDSPRDLLERCVAAIATHESTLHAWVQIDLAAARREADRQTELIKTGHDCGTLQGIPLGIKDLIDMAGWPTRAGSPLRETHVAASDAPLVQRLRAAGAVLIGKTVTTEFACFDPPPTRNPWRLDRTPGGSSSGSAAGVAARMCCAALGSQTGGSIVRPASFCGVAGFKPTFGRIELTGVVPVSRHLDHAGPIARSVTDLAHLFYVLDGADSPRTSRLLEGEPIEPPRVRWLVFREFFRDAAAPDVLEAFESALDQLRAGGAEIADGTLPAEFADVHRRHRDLMAIEAAEVHQHDFARHESSYGPHVGALIREGLELAALRPNVDRLAEALRAQQVFRAAISQMLSDHTVALMPSTLTAAPGPESTGDPRFNSPWSFAGVPTVTIPCGLNAEGLPCGLQILGGPHTDYALLDVAAWCERQIAFHSLPPLLSRSSHP